MNLTAIDIIGTVRGLVKFILKELLLLLAILVFGLSAPLLFTLGAEWAVWQNPSDVASWAASYFLLGPFACAIWMVFICHFHSVRLWQREGRLDSWREDHGGLVHTVGKSIWFMVGGFIGSAIAEGVFLFGANQVFTHEPTRQSLMTIFAIAPLAVFAPVILVLLKRSFSQNESVA